MNGLLTQINFGYAAFKVSLFILALAVFGVRAARLPVKIYTSADGLSSSASFNLLRDGRGFVWLCSRDGLVRFDGYRFITYRIGGEDADTAVFDLIPTRGGAYWIDLNRGTDYRFLPPQDEEPVVSIEKSASRQTGARIPLAAEPLANDEPLPRFEDSSGNLWNAEGNRVNRLGAQSIAETFELDLPGIAKDKISVANFVQGQNDAFWLTTNQGLVRRLSDNRLVHYSFDAQNGGNDVRHLAEDKQGRVWVARSDGLAVLKIESVSELDSAERFSERRAVLKKGVVNADGQPQLPSATGEAVYFSFADLLRNHRGIISQTNYQKPEFFKIICGADGEIWMASNHGLVVFDGARFQHYTTAQGLATDVIAQIAEDNEGSIWLASYGGLHRLNPKGLTTYDEADGLERNRIHSIYEDASGDLNVVSGNFNVSRLDAESGAFRTGRPQIPENALWVWSSNAAFLDSRGDWWLNTSVGVYRYANAPRAEDLRDKPPTEIFNEKKGLLSDNNVRVFEDSNGDVWFAPWVTSKRLGLSRWRRLSGQIENFTTADGLHEQAVASAFSEDAAGNLWFGFATGGSGVARFRDGRFTFVNDPDVLKAGITDIYRDRAGRMWIATNSSGLFRSDSPEADEPTFRRYRIADGLASDNVRCIAEDLYGNIYVGTVRGVNRLSPETGRIKYYGTADGLASDFINTARRDRSGAIWFGTFNGLSKLVPEPDAPAVAPPILISGLRIAGEDYSVSPLGQRQVFVPEQNASRNNLQIDFLSVSSGGNAPARYQFKLEGAGNDWSQPSAESSVTFANLSPGAYRFLVRAVNADDAASEQPAVVSFIILRPVWQRWWFLTIAAIVISAAIYSLYSYRVRQIIKLERVRTRIATDLHDDIGSSLSKIAILSEVVRRNPKASEPLEIIADTSREMVDSMSDIVWAINPERDNLSDLIQRIRRFAEDVLSTLR